MEKVERHIRVSGVSNQKAPRIQAILRTIRRQRAKIDLQFLAGMPDDGRKTCNAVNPRCDDCVLVKWRPFGQRRLSACDPA